MRKFKKTLSLGVRFAGACPCCWSRSLFNGLAQVIAQSTRDAGEIKLTAAADALTPATVTLTTQPCFCRDRVCRKFVSL